MNKKFTLFICLVLCLVALFGLTVGASAAEVEPSVIMPSDSLYHSAWNLLSDYIYGVGAELTPEMNLTLTFLSTLVSLFVVSVPFIVVWFVLRLITRW